MCRAAPPAPAAITRYVLGYWRRCRINIYYYVEVDRHLYSVPYPLVRKQVDVR